jgi:hypothetical protein
MTPDLLQAARIARLAIHEATGSHGHLREIKRTQALRRCQELLDLIDRYKAEQIICVPAPVVVQNIED